MRYLLAAVVAAVGVAGSAQDTTTAKYVSKDGGYSVRFPKGAEVKTKTQDAPGGLTMLIAGTETDSKAHMVMVMALPPGAVKAVSAKTILDGAVKGAIDKSGGKEVSQKNFTFGKEKHPARELVVDKDGNLVKTHIIIADPKVFVLVVGGPGEFGTSKAAAEFLGSLEITPAKKTAVPD